MERDHVRLRQQRVEIDKRHPASGRGVRFQATTSAPIPRATLATRSDTAKPDYTERLAVKLHAFERSQAPARTARSMRVRPRAGEHQCNRVLGDRPVAVALDVWTVAARWRRHVHVARRAGAENTMCLSEVHCAISSVGM